MSDPRKAQQWKIMGLAGVGGVTLLGILGWVMNASEANLVGTTDSPAIDPTIIADVTSSASPELSWISQSKAEIEKLTTQVTELTSSVTALKEDQAKQIADLTAQYDDALLRQQQDINTLKGGDPTADPNAAAQDGGLGQDFVSAVQDGAGGLTGLGSDSAGKAGAATGAATASDGFGTSFTLSAAPGAQDAKGGITGPAQAGATNGGDPTETAAQTEMPESHVRKLESYVPAGSYAPAMVIAGVDASAGVKSQENPVPVLLRLTGPVTTAAAGAGPGSRVDLTGCTVVGSAAADLSSERVYVRLTTLTCLNHRGEVLEVPVAGIVVGSGKAGVRGKVVSREGTLVRNAAIAGVLQGIGQTASSSAQSITGSSGLDSTVTSIAGASAAGALGGGISGAANTLAQYYIQRAEQYQPVVSLYGGTSVEVVFLDGVDLR